MSTESPLHIDDAGQGPAFLLLHGGAGPDSVRPFAARLAATGGARVIVPTHPGFSGTASQDDLRTPADLADRYAALLDELDLVEVTLVGFSLGGWIVAELALRRPSRVAQAVIVDGVGLEVEGHEVADVSALAPAEIAALSWHDPSRAPDPSALSDVQRSQVRANIAAVVAYGGRMVDPDLRARLAQAEVPVLVLWGESDGIVDPHYGQAYADAFPDARFELIPEAGHVPQLEQPAALLAALQRAVRAPA